jgi:predicted transcriptional regulator
MKLLLNLVAIVLLCLGTIWAQELELISFEIKDQFDRTHTDKEYRGRLLVIIGSDKGGAEFNDQWARAIRNALSYMPRRGEITFLRYADVRGVPFFLKGTIKGKFPKDEEFWVLLDWKGQIAKAYQFQKGASNIVVFDRDGLLVHRAHGREPEEDKVAAIADAIKSLVTD